MENYLPFSISAGYLLCHSQRRQWLQSEATSACQSALSKGGFAIVRTKPPMFRALALSAALALTMLGLLDAPTAQVTHTPQQQPYAHLHSRPI
jgi:hypothetical protein